MTLEDLQAICKKLPGITEDIKWEDHLCFNIGGKMFLVASPNSVPVSASFKVTDDDFEVLSTRMGFKPADYLARHKWVFTNDINNLSKKEWVHFINQSYQLVSSKLTVKLKKQLGLM